jgi:hypothetical protein
MKEILSVFIVLIKMILAFDVNSNQVPVEAIKSHKIEQLINLRKLNGTAEFIAPEKISLGFSELGDFNENMVTEQSDIYQEYGNVNDNYFFTYAMQLLRN